MCGIGVDINCVSWLLKIFSFSRSARGSPVAACQRTGLRHQRGNMWSLFTKTPEHTFSMAKTTSSCNRYDWTFSLCDQLLCTVPLLFLSDHLLELNNGLQVQFSTYICAISGINVKGFRNWVFQIKIFFASNPNVTNQYQNQHRVRSSISFTKVWFQLFNRVYRFLTVGVFEDNKELDFI